MNKKLSLGLMFVLSTAFLAGCAHKATEQNVDNQVEHEPVKTRTQLRAQTDELLNTSKNFSDAQRQQLKDLRDDVRKQSDAMRLESLKLRAVMIKEVLSPDYKKSEVSLMEKKIRKLENKRLSVLFDAVDRANTILGRGQRSPQNRAIMDEFMEFHGGHEY